MRKIFVLLTTLLIAASVLLAACQPAAPTTQQQQSTTEQSPGKQTAGQKEPVTLRFLKIADELEAKSFAEMVDAWHKIDGGKWSYVTVEYDTKPFAELFPSISKAVATGSTVDIVQADGPDVKHFAYNNVLMDLTPYFTEEELKTWIPQSIAEGSLGKKFYGPPLAQSCQLMWYNEDMMAEAGIDVSDPKKPWTYGDNGTALSNWQKLTQDKNGDGNPEVFGLAFSGPWDYFQSIPARSNGEPGSPTYVGVGSDGITFDGYFNTPEAIEAYQFQQDMVLKYKVMSAEQTNNPMLSGLAATQIYQDLIMGTQKDQFPDFKMGAIYPPYFKTPFCNTGSWHYGITTTTKHFEEALAFVKFASSDEGAKFIWKYKSQLPANVNLLNTLPDFQDVPERAMMRDFMVEYGQPRRQTPAYTEYNALWSEFYNSLVTGSNVEELVAEYTDLMEESAAKYAGWENK